MAARNPCQCSDCAADRARVRRDDWRIFSGGLALIIAAALAWFVFVRP